MSGADVFDAVLEALPSSVHAHPGLPVVAEHLRRLDGDTSLHHLYLEWNPLKGHLDPSFVLPTRAFGAIPLPLEDVAAEVTVGLDTEAPGRRLLREACRRWQARGPKHPLYPRAFSVSLEGATEGFKDVALVFTDFGPPIALADEGLTAAFADLALPESQAARANVDVLGAMSVGLRLDHVGAGYRRGQPVNKAYFGGRMRDLVDRFLEPATAGLARAHASALRELADQVGDRPCAMVVDATGGRIVRVGFELELDVRPDEHRDYADLIFAHPLWGHAPEALRAEQAHIRRGPVERPLPGGYVAVLDTGHLKVSFDGTQTPEWKAYLRLQKVFGADTKQPSTSDKGA